MKELFRVTAPTKRVLAVMLNSGEPIWGLVISKESGLPTGTIYPILARLESLDWAESAWEVNSDRPGPRRKFFKLTDEGREAASLLLSQQLDNRKVVKRAKYA